MKSRDRVSLLQISQFVAVGLLLLLPASAWAQTVVATIPAGIDVPRAVAVNPTTGLLESVASTG